MNAACTAIYNFLRVGDRLATAGQPIEEELPLIASAGFELVINLALEDSPYSTPGEKRALTELGVDYINIPVIFTAPTVSDFSRFVAVYQAHQQRKCFIHCIANKRVSVFVALYHLHCGQWNEQQAREWIAQIWEMDAVWAEFFERVRGTLCTE